MGAQCLSVNGPCKDVCKVCQDSYDKYVHDTEDKLIRDAVRLLTSKGYNVECPLVQFRRAFLGRQGE